MCVPTFFVYYISLHPWSMHIGKLIFILIRYENKFSLFYFTVAVIITCFTSSKMFSYSYHIINNLENVWTNFCCVLYHFFTSMEHAPVSTKSREVKPSSMQPRLLYRNQHLSKISIRTFRRPSPSAKTFSKGQTTEMDHN